MKTWRQRLGSLLLTERVQGKRWNLSKAASEAGLNAGTVKRIEAGDNYEIAKLEAYAEALGRPVELWLGEALGLPEDVLRRFVRGHGAGEDFRTKAPTKGHRVG